MNPNFKLLIFCGAGISAESGLSTFRDDNGLWHNHDINEVCNLRTFERNKEKVFNFYNDRKQDILAKQPNQAHFSISEFQKQYPNNVTIYTSNIDNLLEKAGCTNVIHVHGDIFTMKCLGRGHIWNIGDRAYDINEFCPICSCKKNKPNIIFFHEQAKLYPQMISNFKKSPKNIETHFLKLFIGTSLKVLGTPVFSLNKGQSILVDKNPNHTEEFDFVIPDIASIGTVQAFDLIKQKLLK